MLEAKIFEVRDRATLIPIMAVKVTSGNPHERALAGWVGYTGESKSNIIVTNLHNLNTYHDVQECDGSEIGRTMAVAMAYIQADWESLQSLVI